MGQISQSSIIASKKVHPHCQMCSSKGGGSQNLGHPLKTEMWSSGAPVVAQQVKNPINVHKDAGSISGIAQWVKGLPLP